LERSAKLACVAAPHDQQRHTCARCSVTTSGWGSGRSNTCRATWQVAMAGGRCGAIARADRGIVINHGGPAIPFDAGSCPNAPSGHR
jgi:hypothetical protein